MPEELPSGFVTLAEKLTLLLETIRPQGEDRRYTDKEVAATINGWTAERGHGPTMSHVYFWQLRTGRSKNPTLEILRALAQFFGVQPAYFVDDNGQAKQIHEELLQLRGFQRLQVRGLAARVARLPDDGLDYVGDVITRIDEALQRRNSQQTDAPTSPEPT